jgi:hypothetical protein
LLYLRASTEEIHLLLQDVCSSPDKFALIYDRSFAETALKMVAPIIRRRSLEKNPSNGKLSSGKGSTKSDNVPLGSAGSSKSFDNESSQPLASVQRERRGSFNGRAGLTTLISMHFEPSSRNLNASAAE